MPQQTGTARATHAATHTATHTWATTRRRARRGLMGLALLGPAAAQAADGAVGTWQGQYSCNQGDTALTLMVQPREGKRDVDALFHFYAHPDNPDVPRGCFMMSGQYDAATGQVSLTAGHWLLHPAGYVTVDLRGRLDGGKDTLSGTVVGPGCTSFTLRRVSAAPRTPAQECRSGANIASLR